MIRKFKALGLALVAVFAMSAVAASTAQAKAGELTTFPAETHAHITATQIGQHALTLTDHPVGGGFANTKCEGVTFTSTEEEPSTEGDTTVLLHPEYTNCPSFGQNATITTTGCEYLFHFETPTASGWHVTTDVVCEAGKAIKIVTGTCEVQVGSQTGLTTSEATNSGTAEDMDILLHTKIHGITYTVTKDNIGCPLNGKGTFHKGDYVGETTVEGEHAEDGEPLGITLS